MTEWILACKSVWCRGAVMGDEVLERVIGARVDVGMENILMCSSECLGDRVGHMVQEWVFGWEREYWGGTGVIRVAEGGGVEVQREC